MEETLAIAVALLLLGRWIKEIFTVLKRFFIPAPVIGGIIFSFVTLFGHETGTFQFTFDAQLKNLLMLAFFTTIGFAASFKMLLTGGYAVALFLGCSIGLILVQNTIGISISYLFDQNLFMGLATGSISLTGGHGTSAAFGPLLVEKGLEAGLTASIASATFGLVAGCMIGGPIGKRLMARYNLKASEEQINHVVENPDIVEGKLTKEQKNIDEPLLFSATCYIIIAMGIGHFIILGLNAVNITIPAYLGPMMVAAAIRMTMNLWELSALAVPLVTILLVQTIVMALFAYFVTFRVMGKDYDAAVIATGHCGFGMGATPNAMANMETFTGANGQSPKAFFVVPIVGSLFIDFVNSAILSFFLAFLPA